MTSRAEVPTKIGLFSTSSTMTRSPRCKCGTARRLLAVDRVEELEKRPLEPPLRGDPQQITVEQLDVAHLGAGDLDGGIKDLVQQQRKIAGLQQARTHLLHPRMSSRLWRSASSVCLRDVMS